MFTRDDKGKIERTIANIIKMNIWQHIYCSVFNWGVINYFIIKLIKNIGILLVSMASILYYLVVILVFPLNLIYYSYNDIKKCKKFCKINNLK